MIYFIILITIIFTLLISQFLRNTRNMTIDDFKIYFLFLILKNWKWLRWLLSISIILVILRVIRII